MDFLFERRRECFLNNLKGKTLKYKRYTKSPLRYGGGKSLAVGLIIEHFPNDIKRVISPFFGGGSVEIASALELDLEVRGFDIFDILINFWQIAITQPQRLFKELLPLTPDKATYEKIKNELRQHFKNEIQLDPTTLARDYFFNFNLSYAPAFLGWLSNIYIQNPTRYQNMLTKLLVFGTYERVKNLHLEYADFESVFNLYPNDFFYCDPPYYLAGNSKIFRGIYPARNFPIHHNGFKHELLCELLHNHKGKFILSYNDCEWVRNAYKDFLILTPKWQYTMGQGETRIGRNRIANGITNKKESHELLIIKK